MTFIGIIANQKEFEIIKSQIEWKNKFNIILINDNNIENLQNIKFEILIIHEKMIIKKHMKEFEKICRNLQYLLVNFDKNMNLEILNGSKIKIITYGLNHKCTVTASSIKEDSIMVALQREILDKNGNLQVIEEQRLKTIENLDVYGHMLLFILNIIYGKFTKN